MDTPTLSFIDVETTGGSPLYDRVIEIGIVRVHNMKIVGRYKSLVNPERSIPSDIQVLTGISPHDVERAPLFEEIFDHVNELLTDAIFVAHNARFDYSFIRAEYARMEKAFKARHLCTAKLSRKLFPRARHHNLDAIMERMDIACEHRHRAFDDALVLWEFYQRLHRMIQPKKLKETITTIMKEATLPAGLTKETVDALPEGAGVYQFYDKEGTPLYVGKSINIRDRVLSHFSGVLGSERSQKMVQQIASIETQTTTGELSALILESQRIKTLLPIYNRQLRQKYECVYLTREEDKKGYYMAQVHAGPLTDEALQTGVIGVFRSKKSAIETMRELAQTHALCHKLTGIESTNRACFAYQLGTCKGACVGREHVLKYNIRFLEAFGSLGIRQWPFSSPVVIEEIDPFTHARTQFVVDRWKVITISLIDPLGQVNTQEAERSFDYDLYKILAKCVMQKKSNITIQPLLQESRSARTAQELQDFDHLPETPRH